MLFPTYAVPLITALPILVSTQALPFALEHVLSAQISITPSLPPIAVPGVTIAVKQITGGIVTGSAMNGTIISGLAYLTLYHNQTFDVPSIVLFGQTDDSQTFCISEMGVGTLTAQVTRIV